MKRIIYFLMILMMAFYLLSCKKAQDDIEVPVSFYYCTLSTQKDSKLPVFEAEIREAVSYNGDLSAILNYYLTGPNSNELSNPFPAATQVVSVICDDTGITLTLTSSFGELTGLDLYVACAAISMTVIEITQCESVIISADNILLDGAEQIVMSADMLYTSDLTSAQ